MERKELLEKHKGSIANLLRVYNAKGDLYKGKYLLISFFISLLFLCFTLLFKSDLYDLIKEIVNLTLGIIPNLLGFSLGAYALLIGLASSSLMGKLSSSVNKKYSAFQRASSVFGFCILIQSTALIISFVIKGVILLQDYMVITLFDSSLVLMAVLNSIVLFIITFKGIYSLLLLVTLTESIFALSQASHFFEVTKDIKNKDD